MRKKTANAVGIDIDSHGIRAVLINTKEINGKMVRTLTRWEEVRGNFDDETELVQGLKSIREKIGISHLSSVVTAVAGKQVYVAQIPFRKLPPDEMKNALRLEIRKNLPFEVNNATLEYQVMGKENDEEVSVLVTVVAGTLLTRHIKNLVSAGIRPAIVDVLPTAISNAFNAGTDILRPGQAYVILHIGYGVCTLVVDGIDVPFFHRNIFVPVDELYDRTNIDKEVLEQERKRRLEGLGEEVIRSLSFYQESFTVATITGIYLLGEYLDKTEILDALSEKTGLTVSILDICSKMNCTTKTVPGRFEIALALALRV